MADEYEIANGVIINDTQPVDTISTDGTMTGSSDRTLVTEKAVKSYVDIVASGFTLQDATTNGNTTTDGLVIGSDAGKALVIPDNTWINTPLADGTESLYMINDTNPGFPNGGSGIDVSGDSASMVAGGRGSGSVINLTPGLATMDSGVVTGDSSRSELRLSDDIYSLVKYDDAGDLASQIQVADTTVSINTGTTQLSMNADTSVQITNEVSTIAMVDDGSMFVRSIGDNTVQLTIEPNGNDAGVTVSGGEFHVGTVGDPRESAFGGGDSYPVDQAWHCDLANTTGLTITGATDVTTEFASDSGSTAGMFGGTTAGKYLLIGSDYSYRGLKVKMTALGTVEPDNLKAETWNGLNDFDTVKYMATNANDIWMAGSQKGYNICTNLDEQWRFGFDPLNPVPNTKTTLIINGTPIEKYWGRLVIETAITTDPTVEQMKLHPDRTEINADGTVEYFGLARMAKTLQAGLQIITPNQNVTPGDANVLYGSATVGQYTGNRFDHIKDDGFLIVQGISSGLDTSIPLSVGFSYYVNGIGTGDIAFDIDVYQVVDGFVFDGSGIPDLYQVVDTITVDSYFVGRSSAVQISAEKLVPGESLAISIRRNASTNPLDTLVEDVVMTNVNVTGWIWK